MSTSSSSYINCGSSISSAGSNIDTNATNLNTDLCGDSGYQSRLCVNLNHELDGENCVCTCCLDNKQNISPENNIQDELSTSKAYKLQLESLVRYIIKDYVKIKEENASLKEDLDSKRKTIELLQEKVELIKVRSSKDCKTMMAQSLYINLKLNFF